MNEKLVQKRLLIDIPESLHRELKSIVALRGITLKRYVLRALKAYMSQEVKV